MSRHGKARRSQSASPDQDNDADYQLALRIAEEMNGEQATPSGAGPSQHSGYDDEADFAYALELQFGDSNGPHHAEEDASSFNPASRSKRSAPPLEASPCTYKKDQPKIASYHPETKDGKTFGTLAAFLAHVKSAQCPTCHVRVFESERDVSRMIQKSKLSSLLQCTNCEDSHCISCTPEPSAKWSAVGVYGKELTWCCVGGRTLLLWVLLCRLDEHFSAIKYSEASSRKPKQQPQEDKRKSKQRGRGGVGFGGSSRHNTFPGPPMPSGLGYASDVFDEYSSWGPGNTLSRHRFDAEATNTSGKARALTAQQSEDQFYDLHLQLIEAVLPSFERESGFDYDPPDSLAEMLVGSKILNYCAELLRNDSLEDATKRKDLYHALIGLLRTLGAHYTTASTAIYNERPLREDKVNLLVMSFHGYPELSTETASSLLDNLTNLNSQSELVLQGARSNEKEFRTYSGQNLLSLCRQICDLRGFLIANSGTYGKATLAKTKTEVSALTDVPDDLILASHAHCQAARALKSAPSGRFKSLISQITTLKTGLPPGIFVRYAESRPDVQKVLIVGPEGTPYANGLFEFDVFCDGSFPNKPPQVLFKTTGGGRVNFNPNLYADGKVCLSLLGTWQGEPWVPGESTLLQVFISIQAMILCEEPWYNEPGREASYGRSNLTEGPSASYNAIIRRHTLSTAILDWLKKTTPLWKDVIDQHFTTNADKILRTAVEWSKLKILARAQASYDYSGEDFEDGHLAAVMPGSHRFTSQHEELNAVLSQLQSVLKNYGASEIVPGNPTPAAPTPPAASSRKAQRNPVASAFSPPNTFPTLPYPPQLPPLNMQPNPYNHYDHSYMPHGFGNFETPTLFTGPGRTLGDGLIEQPETEAQNTSGRGGSFLGALGFGRGKYKTRSSTRGRGGLTPVVNPGGPPSSSSQGFGSTPRGGSYLGPPGHGGYSQDRGRGGRGGRAGRGGSGGLTKY